jgi:uncharacterized protein YbjT (DUF2867 family)
MKKLCVIGGTGQQGYQQVLTAARAGQPVTAIGKSRIDQIRANDMTGDMKAAISWCRADLLDGDALREAFSGVAYLLVNMPSSSFNDGQTLLDMFDTIIAMADAARVEKIIFNTSMYVPAAPSGFQALDIRRQMIDRLARGGVTFIVIKPVIYMDNLLTAWARPRLVQENVLCYPHHPALEVSWICLRDVARIMLALAERGDYDGQEVTIGGPQSLKGPQLAAILSDVLGRDIIFEPMPIEHFGQLMGGLFSETNDYAADKIVTELVKVYRWYNTSEIRPFKVDMAPLTGKIGLALTPFADWAAQVNWDGT